MNFSDEKTCANCVLRLVMSKHMVKVKLYAIGKLYFFGTLTGLISLNVRNLYFMVVLLVWSVLTLISFISILYSEADLRSSH